MTDNTTCIECEKTIRMGARYPLRVLGSIQDYCKECYYSEAVVLGKSSSQSA